MALIKCPECQREISDKVKACPHCGYPLSLDESTDSLTPATSGANEITTLPPTKTRKIIPVIAVVVIIIIAAIVALSIQKKNQQIAVHDEYVDNLVSVRYLMLDGAADAEKLGNLVKSVWYNTIYEKRDGKTDKYTINDTIKYRTTFHSDFNLSLRNLYADDSTKSTVEAIQTNQSSVAELMKSIQNPTEEFKICYDTISEMYEAYSKMTSLAVSPSGSLSSYSENFNKADDDFMTFYNKLDTQIPNKIRENKSIS